MPQEEQKQADIVIPDVPAPVDDGPKIPDMDDLEA